MSSTPQNTVMMNPGNQSSIPANSVFTFPDRCSIQHSTPYCAAIKCPAAAVVLLPAAGKYGNAGQSRAARD